MRRLVILGLICAPAGLAQFFSLATTHDGSEVLFITSLRERGTNQVTYEKIFAWNEKGLTLLLQQPNGPMFPALRPSSISISGDGALLASDLWFNCGGGSLHSNCGPSSGVVLDRRTSRTRARSDRRVSDRGAGAHKCSGGPAEVDRRPRREHRGGLSRQSSLSAFMGSSRDARRAGA